MSKCWYCNNELTTGDNPKHFGICNKCYDEMFKSGDTIIRSFTNKITELQKQLEDAEEHIDNLELQLREQYQLVDEKDEQLAEKEKDKISFAVEQLEKVKEKVVNQKDYSRCDNYKECWNIIIDIIIDIDKQINQLKEVK